MSPTSLVPDPILDLDVCALAAATRRGDLTASEVTRAYLSRLNAHNPHLHAVITVNPQAEADAARLDTLPEAKRGVLHGVPLLIKDNIDVAGLPTTAGSLLMLAHVPASDAPLVARLRAAGAVLLGKANLTEWANFMTLGMPNGFSGAGGQTVNPWNVLLNGGVRDTGGSSSGSGAAVAARLCAAAIGTETSGSIVSPAHQSGVVGVKPTVGLVPRTGVVPISSSQDTAGPLTRSVRDAALLLSVMAGPDEQDAASRRLPVPDLILATNALEGAHIGIIRDEAHLTPEETAALAVAETHLKAAGATLHDLTFPTRAELAGWQLEVLEYEFKATLNAYLSGVQHGPRSMSDLLDQIDEDPARLAPYGQTLLHAAQGTRGDLSERSYAYARERDLDLSARRGLDALYAEGLDAIVFPGIHGYGIVAKAGYPSLALPIPLPDAPPCGILLTSPAGSDARLMALAAHLNTALGGVQFPPDPAPSGSPAAPTA